MDEDSDFPVSDQNHRSYFKRLLQLNLRLQDRITDYLNGVNQIIRSYNDSGVSLLNYENNDLCGLKRKHYFPLEFYESVSMKLDGAHSLYDMQEILWSKFSVKKEKIKLIRNCIIETNKNAEKKALKKRMKQIKSKEVKSESDLKELRKLRSEFGKVDACDPIKYEWDISNVNFDELARKTKSKIHPIRLQLRWIAAEHPSINKSDWSASESMAVVEYAKMYKYHSWNEVAKQVDNNRTGLQCLVHHQRNFNFFNSRNLSRKEDSTVSKMVNYLNFTLSNGSCSSSVRRLLAFVVAARVQTRNVVQIDRLFSTIMDRQRCRYYTFEEDMEIYELRQKYENASWYTLSKKLNKNIPAKVLKARYEALMSHTLSSFDLTISEKAVLLDLVSSGKTLHFDDFKTHFPKRNTLGAKRLYFTFLKATKDERFISSITYDLTARLKSNLIKFNHMRCKYPELLADAKSGALEEEKAVEHCLVEGWMQRCEELQDMVDFIHDEVEYTDLYIFMKNSLDFHVQKLNPNVLKKDYTYRMKLLRNFLMLPLRSIEDVCEDFNRKKLNLRPSTCEILVSTLNNEFARNYIDVLKYFFGFLVQGEFIPVDEVDYRKEVACTNGSVHDIIWKIENLLEHNRFVWYTSEPFDNSRKSRLTIRKQKRSDYCVMEELMAPKTRKSKENYRKSGYNNKQSAMMRILTNGLKDSNSGSLIACEQNMRAYIELFYLIQCDLRTTVHDNDLMEYMSELYDCEDAGVLAVEEMLYCLFIWPILIANIAIMILD